MYRPAHFAEDRREVLHGLMQAHPFATLVTRGKDGAEADHLPLHLAADASAQGTLSGHVARANPVWREAADTEVLAIFQGPQTYVTPSWYPTKHEHGKAVPTWNYVIVHARGRLRIIDDPGWLRGQLDILVDSHEAAFAQPWHIADAPPDYIDRMLAAVVGIEITIASLEGKWKLSQNQPAVNRAGVVAGLRRQGTAESLPLADLVAGTPRP